MISCGRIIAVLALFVCGLSDFTERSLAQTAADFSGMPAPPEIGETAPPLPVSRWIGGESVDTENLEGSYVVVFNITACPSCRKALPFLSDLSASIGEDVPILNVFAHELPVPGDTEDVASLEKVRSLLTALGDQVDIPVGVDGPERQISALWGIYVFPSAYLVQDGKIAWAGDPTWLESVLQQVRDGSFDPVAAQAEQEAYDAERLAAHTASTNGDYDKALSIVDALLTSYPGESSLYFFKYQLLVEAGRDGDAGSLVDYLISTDPRGFDWDHFVPLTYLVPEEPDFDLALRVADMAIRNAEWGYAVASLLSWKAKIHLARFDRQGKRGSRSDIRAAADLVERAVEAVEVSGDVRDRRRFEAELQFLTFRALAGEDDAAANQALRSLLSREAPRTDWFGVVKDALQYQNSPDTGLLLWASDRAFMDAFDEAAKAEALATKALVYMNAGNTADAATLYQKASETAGFAGLAEKQDQYEAAISTLTVEQ